jgi:hypothetical protein
MADFEKATRIKLRFECAQGQLSVEDLWDLPLKHTSRANLDDTARALSRRLRDDLVESFVDKLPQTDETVQLAFDIVKHVIDVKLAERDAAKLAAENREKKQRLLATLAKKEDEQLSELSIEDLRAQINAL